MAGERTEATIRNAGLIREALYKACARNEIAILSTPYLRFETCFLLLEASQFHCHANMELEDAKYGMRSPELSIRFPYGQHFYQGATRLLGLGRALGRQSLMLSIPAILEDGEYRRAYRVTRVGRVPVTFSTRKYELLSGHLVNLSTSGVLVHFSRDYEEGELLVGDTIHLAFGLNDSLRINTRVNIRHVRERLFGAEFRPPLEDELLEDLSRWVFQRREAEIFAQAPGPAAKDEETPEAGLVLVSASAELGERLAALVPAGLPPLRRVAPTLQSVKDLGPSRKALVILHADSAAWEARKRLRTLAEALPAALPRVLIGTGVDPGHLAEMGAEVKASWTYPLQASPGSIFGRLLLGIFRKHFP